MKQDFLFTVFCFHFQRLPLLGFYLCGASVADSPPSSRTVMGLNEGTTNRGGTPVIKNLTDHKVHMQCGHVGTRNVRYVYLQNIYNVAHIGPLVFR